MRFGYGGWWTWLGGLAIIAFIALVIYALVVVISRAGRTHAHSSYEEQWNDFGSAMGILAERYARGEINDEEYQQKKKALRNL